MRGLDRCCKWIYRYADYLKLPRSRNCRRRLTTLREWRTELRQDTALKRVDREQMDRLPLSFAQQRLWFLEQMEGELTAYNMPFAWRLRGTLHAEALRRALEAIVQRHEPLRTTFAVVDEEPVQVIRTIERLELPVEDLSALESQDREAEIVRRCRSEAERPFDLTRDLMLRAILLRLAEDEHVLLLTMHHIASDGWSLRVLWRDWSGSTTLIAAARSRTCRNCPCSMPIMPCGNAASCRARDSRQLLAVLARATRWRECAGIADRSPASARADLPRRCPAISS